jgi:hypothetical protein
MKKRAGAWMALMGIIGLAQAAAPQELRLLDGRTQPLELVDAMVGEAMNTREVPAWASPSSTAGAWSSPGPTAGAAWNWVCRCRKTP